MKRLLSLMILIVGLVCTMVLNFFGEVSAQTLWEVAQDNAWVYPNIAMRRDTTDQEITEWIWHREFNDGVIGPVTRNDPIAATGDFQYRYSLKPPYKPTVEQWQVRYIWRIEGSSKKAGIRQWQSVKEDGVGEFTVSVPDEIGKYKLKVTLQIYDPTRQNRLRTERRSHTLYVLWDEPVNVGLRSWKTEWPKTAWLDVATDWAQGATTEAGILDSLNASVYANPFGWIYLSGECDGKEGNALTLIEQTRECAVCHDFRDVWRFLAAVLGIKNYGLAYYANWNNPDAGEFLTSTRPALDGNRSKNIINEGTGLRDRYRFGNHQLGLNADSTTFYDPTFGLSGQYVDRNDLEGNVFCKMGSFGSSDLCPDADCCHVLSLPKAAVYVITADPYAEEYHRYRTDKPKMLKEAISFGLNDLIPSGDDSTDLWIAQALIHINNSLADELWVDQLHLTEQGEVVFNQEKLAVQQLIQIGNSPKPIIDAIDLLVMVDATVARTAINEASVAGGSPEEIAKAEIEMVEAQNNMQNGHPDRAIERYKKAWELAHMAVIAQAEPPIPRELKWDVWVALDSLPPSGDVKADRLLNQALDRIANSLDDELWVDPWHLTVGAQGDDEMNGKKVFEEEKKAVQKLMNIGKKQVPFASDLQEAIATLAKVDSLLANVAIDDAVTAGGSAKEIEKAEKEMDKASNRINGGRYDKAIDYYKHAWQYAQKAVEKLLALSGIEEGSKSTTDELPIEYRLNYNYPNPFNPSTTISFQIPKREELQATPTSLKIFDVRGRLVITLMDESLLPGNYSVHWDGSDHHGEKVSSGIYFYTITAGNFRETKKMLLLK